MHIWLINQTPRPHKLPIVWHPRPHTHADTLPEAGKGRQLLSWSAVYSGRGCPRGVGRLRVCHINNSQVGWSGVFHMASHCSPSEPRNPVVMAAPGPRFPEGQLRKRRGLWGTSALISPLRLQPAASQPGVHFKLCIYRERQKLDYFERKSLMFGVEIGLQVDPSRFSLFWDKEFFKVIMWLCYS